MDEVKVLRVVGGVPLPDDETTYVVALPAGFDASRDHAGNVYAYLVDLSYAVENVSVAGNYLVVEGPSDPTALLTSYVSPSDAHQALKQQLANLDLEDSQQLTEAVSILTELMTAES